MATVLQTQTDIHRSHFPADLEQGIPSLDGLPSADSVRQTFEPTVICDDGRFPRIRSAWKQIRRSSVTSSEDISVAAVSIGPQSTTTSAAPTEATADSHVVSIATVTTTHTDISRPSFGELSARDLPLRTSPAPTEIGREGIASQNGQEDLSPQVDGTPPALGGKSIEIHAQPGVTRSPYEDENQSPSGQSQTEDRDNFVSRPPETIQRKDVEKPLYGRLEKHLNEGVLQQKQQIRPTERKSVHQVFTSSLSRTVLSRLRDQQNLHYVSYVKDYPCEEYVAPDIVLQRFINLKPELQQLISTCSKPAKYASGDATKLYLTLPVRNNRSMEPVIVAVCRTKDKADKVLTLVLKSNCKSWGFPFKVLFNPTLELKSWRVDTDALASADYTVKAYLSSLTGTTMGVLVEIYHQHATESDGSSSLSAETLVGRATLGGFISIDGSVYGVTVGHLLANFEEGSGSTRRSDIVDDGAISSSSDIERDHPPCFIGIIRAYAFGGTVRIPDSMDVCGLPSCFDGQHDWALVEISNPSVLSESLLPQRMNRRPTIPKSTFESTGSISEQRGDNNDEKVHDLYILAGASGVRTGRYTSETVSIQLSRSWFDVAVVVLNGPPLGE
jgi:hypothetical protein